jgi:hypothetical protein
MIGLYLLPQQYISHDLGWDMNTLSGIQKELMDLDLVRFDKHEIVYVPTFLKHNPIRNISQMKGAVNTLMNLPESAFKGRVIESLQQSVDSANDTVKGGMEGALRGPLGPLEEAGSKRIKNKETRIKKQETRDPQKVAEYNRVIDQKFEDFWHTYPRKKDKKRARSRFASLFPLDMNKEKRQKRLQHMGLHLNQYIEETSDLEERYVKHPATWLNSVDFDSPPEPHENLKLEWGDVHDNK